MQIKRGRRRQANRRQGRREWTEGGERGRKRESGGATKEGA